MPLNKGLVFFFSPFCQFLIFLLYNQEKSEYLRKMNGWMSGWGNGWMRKYSEGADPVSLYSKRQV